jgi:hypothetical protein
MIKRGDLLRAKSELSLDFGVLVLLRNQIRIHPRNEKVDTVLVKASTKKSRGGQK